MIFVGFVGPIHSNQGVGCRVECHKAIEPFRWRCVNVVPQTELESKIRTGLIVVLNEQSRGFRRETTRHRALCDRERRCLPLAKKGDVSKCKGSGRICEVVVEEFPELASYFKRMVAVQIARGVRESNCSVAPALRKSGRPSEVQADRRNGHLWKRQRLIEPLVYAKVGGIQGLHRRKCYENAIEP